MFALQQPGAAEALELALLQDAQELGLRCQAHLADLVEEQHAAGGQLDLPGLGLLCAREGAALVAEELGLEQLLGERRAVQRDERAAFARGGLVDEARDDFLARAGLAADHDGRVGGGHLRRLLEHALPISRWPDDEHARLAMELGADTPHGVVDANATAWSAGGGAGSRQPFVRDRHGEVVGDPAGHRHVAPVVGVALLRPEREAKKFMSHSRRDAEDGAVAARDEPRGRIDPADHRQRLASEVADDEILRDRRPEHERLHGWKTGRGRLDADLPVPFEGRQRQSIVREHLVHNFGYLRKHRSDVEHVRDRAKQLEGSVEIGGKRSADAGIRFYSAEHFHPPLIERLSVGSSDRTTLDRVQ